MTSKKYTLLAVLFCLFASTVFAQTTATRSIYGAGLDVTDANLISSKNLPQHNEFLAGTYDYPAKPRDMWEIGLSGGVFNILGDVRGVPSIGTAVHIRKALGHVISLRLQGMYGRGVGQNYRPSFGYAQGGNANPWYDRYNPQGTQTGNTKVPPVYYNYRTIVQDLGLQILANVHNIRFYKDQTALTFYALGGIGVTTWCAQSDVLDANNRPYDYSGIYAASLAGASKKDILKKLKDLQDHTFESTDELDHSIPHSSLFRGYYKPSVTVGMGLAFRLNDRLNIALEDRHSYVKNDLLDNVRWSEQKSLTRDFDTYNYLSLGLNVNLGNKKKRVEPLYWLNPLNYAYSEIRNPRLMRIPPPILIDSDGDGVIDQFDLEQTPPGCPVDTHGVSLDTDGDGVPDCKDKEKITPTYCQPVDADGVGKCPCPEGCAAAVPECSVLLGALPSVSFAPNSNVLSKDAQSALANAASRIRANPTCKVVVVGYCAATKRQQQLSWDHVNKVITYLVEKEGISGDRFIFSSGQEGGDCNTVDLRAAAPGEDGPNTVAPPHPNLRKK
jgi:outer membrane protein OmpA-like peptidoglycan-associated protein